MWTSTTAELRKTVVIGDGNYIVSFKLPDDSTVTRNASRFKFSQVVPGSPTTSYKVVIANNRVNEGGKWAIGMAKRPPTSKTSRDDDPVEMAMIVPDDGMVVVTGTAPIVGVKRATIASTGTTYVVESMTGNGFLIKVLDSSTAHPVKVFFPGTGSPGGIEVPNGACWHFFEDADEDNEHEDGENEDCDELTAYANTFLNL